MKKLFVLFLMLFFIAPAFASDFDDQKFLRNYAQILPKLRGSSYNELTIEYSMNKIWRIDGQTVDYRNGKIEFIGSDFVHYDLTGEIDRIGNEDIRYDAKGRIIEVGNKFINYDLRNDVFTIDGL